MPWRKLSDVGSIDQEVMIECLLDAVGGLPASSPGTRLPSAFTVICPLSPPWWFFRSEEWRAAHLVAFCCEVWTEEPHCLVAHLPGSPTSIQCGQQAWPLPQHHRWEAWLQGPAAVYRWICGKAKAGEAPGLEMRCVVLGRTFHQRCGRISSLACPCLPLPVAPGCVGLRMSPGVTGTWVQGPAPMPASHMTLGKWCVHSLFPNMQKADDNSSTHMLFWGWKETV